MKIRTRDKKTGRREQTGELDHLTIGIDLDQTYTIWWTNKHRIMIAPGTIKKNDGLFLTDGERDRAIELDGMELAREIKKMLENIPQNGGK